MITTLLFLLVGLAALYSGGELLVRAAVQIGEWCHLTPLVTGLTIVAFGTSAPELAVSIDAALVGSSEIAIANVVGSNFANMALVLALSAVIAPVAIEKVVLHRDLPVMLVGFVLVILMMTDQSVGRFEGVILMVTLAGYLVYVIRQSRKFRKAMDTDIPEVHMTVPVTLLSLAGGVLLLALGGHWLVKGAVALASQLGLAEAVIGMTVVAVGTSLPELTASMISVVRGHGNMAIGNVVGSNIWNTLGILGLTSTVVPLSQGQVTSAMVLAMVTAGVLLWILCRTRFQLSRIEGWLLLTGFLLAQWWFVVS